MSITMTHCSACHALVNPSWGECFVCGHHINKREQAAKWEVEHQDKTALPELDMDLETFEREGRALEIKTPWLAAPLWFVPGQVEAEALVKGKVHRGRIWTAQELRDLLAIPGMTREQVKKVAMAKTIFEGSVTA